MKLSLTVLFLFCLVTAYSQSTERDTTTIELQPVEIKPYFSQQSILKLTSSGHTLSSNILAAQSPTSLTTALNNVAGIRMEERSPGSYRVAMRGSLIRSPFGIRNTKIYIDEIPFTDAGGNTYLNLLDLHSIADIQLIKGPDGSLFGANSGGVIRINPFGFNTINNEVSLGLMTGSFGTFQENVNINRKVNEKYQFAFNQAYLTSDGYREQSALKRHSIQTAQQYSYSAKGKLKLFALYTDMQYQTPGGLTQIQYEENPKAARPASGPNPSAKDQQAAIYNKTFYAGVMHEYIISSKLAHFIGLYGSYTDFENPFITNYEFRTEKNIGLRTFLSYLNQDNTLPFQFQIGIETSKGWNKINNFDNNKGIAGLPQAKDLLDNGQTNLFVRTQIDLTSKWLLEGSLGLNKNNIHYETFFPVENISKGQINFKDVWMPRIASSYEFSSQNALRASLSKGYSTPTIAEVRSSDNRINNDLLAESGVNYEVGYKYKSKSKFWLLDIALYQYHMKNSIVRKLHDSGVEYYTNAGEIKQKGAELSFWSYLNFNSNIIKSLQYNAAFTYNYYRFGDYVNLDKNFKGNKVTSVPDWTFNNALRISFSNNFQLDVNHNHTSSIPLDDANTVFADDYNLIQAKVSWSSFSTKFKTNVQLYIGSDNILNQTYSLGNDINAFGGRYFNAAPGRNFYIGTKLLLGKK